MWCELRGRKRNERSRVVSLCQNINEISDLTQVQLETMSIHFIVENSFSNLAVQFGTHTGFGTKYPFVVYR